MSEPAHMQNSGQKGSISAASCFPQSAERLFIGGASAASNSFGSPSTFSESSHWEPTGKQPISSSCRNFSSRCSFMLKPVYPLVFRNPVPDTDPFDSTDKNSTSRLILGENRTSPSDWPNNSCGLLHKTFIGFQKMEASPETNKRSRREGFRLSSASSYDLAFDGEGFDMSEHIDKEFRWPNCSRGDQNCGLCGRLLWQKSPWSSRRIVSSGNMPIAAVLHCTHVFHAECLDQTTPKTKIHDPPCSLCLKTSGVTDDESSLISEPLQMGLRSVRRNQQVVISDALGLGNNSGGLSSDGTGGSSRTNQSLPVAQSSGSWVKSHLKKHLISFKGRRGKGSFGTKHSNFK